MKVAYISCANSQKDANNGQGLLDRLGAFGGAVYTLWRMGVHVLALTEWGKRMSGEERYKVCGLMKLFGWSLAGEVPTDRKEGPGFEVAVFLRDVRLLALCDVGSATLRYEDTLGVCRVAAFTYSDPLGPEYKVMFVHLTLDFEGAKWDEDVRVLCQHCSKGWSAIGDFNRIVEDFDRRTALLKPAGLVYGGTPSDITFSPWKTDVIPEIAFAGHPELLSDSRRQFSPLDCAMGPNIYNVRVFLPLPHLPEVGHLPLEEKIALFESSMRGVEPYQTVSDHFVLVAEVAPSK